MDRVSAPGFSVATDIFRLLESAIDWNLAIIEEIENRCRFIVQ